MKVPLTADLIRSHYATPASFDSRNERYPHRKPCDPDVLIPVYAPLFVSLAGRPRSLPRLLHLGDSGGLADIWIWSPSRHRVERRGSLADLEESGALALYEVQA